MHLLRTALFFTIAASKPESCTQVGPLMWPRHGDCRTQDALETGCLTAMNFRSLSPSPWRERHQMTNPKGEHAVKMYHTPRRRRIPRLSLLMLLASLSVLTQAGCAASTNSDIDWADVIQFNGIRYLYQLPGVGRTPTKADLGGVIASVRFELEGHETDPSYQLHDGDAAYLPAGTPVYSVRGYEPTFRLAANEPQRGLVFYEVLSNPKATQGRDLLDIASKVSSISIVSPQDVTTVLASITQRSEVSTLVTLLMHAPVNQALTPTSPKRYFIAFRLQDGTAVTRVYFPASHYLGPGIIVPAPFNSAIGQAISSAQHV